MAGFDPNNPHTIMRNGQVYVWQPSTELDEQAAYLGVDRDEAARILGVDPAAGSAPGTGRGSWVPASYAHEGGQLGKMLGLLALAGGGGGLLAGALTGGLAGAGAAGATGGATGAAGAGTAGSAAGAATGAGTAAGAASGAAGAGAAGGGGGMFGISIPGLGKVGLLDLLSIGGDVAGKVSDSRAAGREGQADYNLRYDQLENQRAATQAALLSRDLEQREYLDDERRRAQWELMYGSALAGSEDASITRPPGVPNTSLKGGLRPSMIANRAQLGQAMQTDAQRRIDSPSTLPALPTLGPLSRTGLEGGGLDSALDWLNLAGGAASLVGKARRLPAVGSSLPDLTSAGGRAVTLPGAPDAPVAGENAFNRNLMFNPPSTPFGNITAGTSAAQRAALRRAAMGLT